ncbi:MAG: hypothetical protein H6611_00870 [Ignavibacteriales bacterium]|nr:hypothetical protein [Ignavibacteriales bacterium]
MNKIKVVLVLSLLLFSTNLLLAQVENTVKETKVKVEKEVEKVTEQAKEMKMEKMSHQKDVLVTRCKTCI